MFVVWQDGGNRVPYVPGQIPHRKVDKVQKAARIQQSSPQPPEFGVGSAGKEASLVAEKYQMADHHSYTKKPAILAQQIMTSPVFTLLSSAKISEAWKALHAKRFRHIPILSAQGKLVGLLSDRDLFRATIESMSMSQHQDPHFSQQSIQHIMVQDVLSAEPQTEIRAIARVFFEERIGAMPIVTERDELVGILTRSDILRTLIKESLLELWI